MSLSEKTFYIWCSLEHDWRSTRADLMGLNGYRSKSEIYIYFLIIMSVKKKINWYKSDFYRAKCIFSLAYIDNNYINLDIRCCMIIYLTTVLYLSLNCRKVTILWYFERALMMKQKLVNKNGYHYVCFSSVFALFVSLSLEIVIII